MSCGGSFGATPSQYATVAYRGNCDKRGDSSELPRADLDRAEEQGPHPELARDGRWVCPRQDSPRDHGWRRSEGGPGRRVGDAVASGITMPRGDQARLAADQGGRRTSGGRRHFRGDLRGSKESAGDVLHLGR